jgi:hypothetical protein
MQGGQSDSEGVHREQSREQSMYLSVSEYRLAQEHVT